MRHLQTFRLIEAVMRAGSIRKAAEDVNITASALNRRIRRFEDEFGYEIFERLPRGVRLNPAGELLIQHIRSQVSDLVRVQSQVADLAGVRRGHVSIACSQALLPYFLPAQIAAYRHEHPGVTFEVKVRDREAAERDLSTFSSDIALVFEPVVLVDFEVLSSIPQQIQVVMDCLDCPHVLPTAEYGVRHLLDQASRRGTRRLSPIVEAESFDFMRHYVLHENAVAFQIPIGLDAAPQHGLAIRPLSTRDVPVGHLLMGQVRGRTLPIASALFARQLAQDLEKRVAGPAA
ncbi:MAG: LysR family transcriptional regulator [Minwuia sp.]|nr:LysR family transcriptional regulator [Minwuia sp.]